MGAGLVALPWTGGILGRPAQFSERIRPLNVIFDGPVDRHCRSAYRGERTRLGVELEHVLGVAVLLLVVRAGILVVRAGIRLLGEVCSLSEPGGTHGNRGKQDGMPDPDPAGWYVYGYRRGHRHAVAQWHDDSFSDWEMDEDDWFDD